MRCQLRCHEVEHRLELTQIQQAVEASDLVREVLFRVDLQRLY
jgi:hypothetical protein